MSPLFFAYLALSFSAASALIALGAERVPSLLRYGSFILLGLSGICAVAGGCWSLLGEHTLAAQIPMGLPWLGWHFAIDPLSGFFLCVVGVLVVAASVYGPGYMRGYMHRRRRGPLIVLGVATGLFVAGMYLVLLAADAFLFMVAWELMSVSSYFLVAYEHQHAANRRAAFLYLLMAHVGALAILLGFGVLAAHGEGFAFQSMREAALSPAWASIAFALAFFGYGMKSGMVPLHAWLPEAHPVAPSHISALMSGVMLKVAIYGLIRFCFDLLHELQWQWGMMMLVIGGASALLGVLYALMQHDLKRLLAYHSVENIGIILMGLGLSVLFLANGHKVAGVLALLAALYHTLNHALFKGLLFLGAGAVLHSCHESDLNSMGGLIRRMPSTALYFLVGCLAISGLPPLNGFVSEWLTFQATLQAPALGSGVLRSILPVAAAVLALSAALAATCFVKVYGVAFLGQARSRHVKRAREVEIGMRSAMAGLAALCVAAGVFPTGVIGALSSIPKMLVGQGPLSATTAGWLWLTPLAPEVASYSAPLVALTLAVTALVFLIVRWRQLPRTQGDPWECGFGEIGPRMQYTATAFSMPIRRVFAPVWGIDEVVEEVVDESQPMRVASIRHQLHVHDRSWIALYEPLGRLVVAAARRVGVIQTGSIHTYLVYSFVTLIVLLWVVT